MVVSYQSAHIELSLLNSLPCHAIFIDTIKWWVKRVQSWITLAKATYAPSKKNIPTDSLFKPLVPNFIPQSTNGFLSNQSVNWIHVASEASSNPSLDVQNKNPAGQGLKTTDLNTNWLSLPFSLFSQPLILRSVVQATALATVPPRAHCCRVRIKVPGGADANQPLHLTGEPSRNPGHKPAPRFFSPSNGATPLCVISAVVSKISVIQVNKLKWFHG